MDIVSALGLGSAAGLNAYIPMLIVGLLDRYTSVVNLPAGWTWLSDGWLLAIVAVLLVVEVVADKIPAVDSINDVVQTIVRPASGGIVFASGMGDPQTVSDSASAFGDGRWVGFAVGAAVALIVHLTKSTARPVANVTTAGLAAPVLSAGEDATSVALSLAAVFAPIVVLVLLALTFFGLGWLISKRRKRSHAGPPPRLEDMDF
ncbi:DUF4126 domain-containing protein [Bowdeniella massiliensis]|uniref:DUF4126 domain-containing protein n=1 Tax=Bowdeniella massiliensis TaxID=2932264 RepID=UPI002028268C|nr:DUF4126 domain-containing protein [Bowdeniella massiliensis]